MYWNVKEYFEKTANSKQDRKKLKSKKCKHILTKMQAVEKKIKIEYV